MTIDCNASMKISPLKQKNIAIIGSGISGLSAAWLLHPHHKVTLYEKDDRLGGHANTVTCQLKGDSVDVDTGFIVYNPVNYPNLVKFFEHLDVETCDTEMTFGISANKGELEYNGTDIRGLFAQRSNLIKPSFWLMIKDLLRFYRQVEAMSADKDIEQLSLGDLLAKYRYGKHFIYDHLLPMGAAIWSTPVDKMLEYPASSFLRFCQNHGLVQLSDRPQWRTVVGGSHQYVEKIKTALGDNIKLNSRIHRIIRKNNGVTIEDHHGNNRHFDEVILACHSDQALDLLDAPTETEKKLLSQFPYQRNIAYLHTDENQMPQRKQAWSSWNYLSSGPKDHKRKVSITYWMNKLQPLNTNHDLFVSLNPLEEPAEGSIIRTFFYDHPAFGKTSLKAQRELWQLQGVNRTWFCGAYFGYGFHEDGLQSGLAVAEQAGGVQRPWRLESPNSRIHVSPVAARHEPQEKTANV